jgi:hypothetical protein
VSGNLPPGVTGNEDAFGPRAEHTEHRECGKPAVLLLLGVEFKDYLLGLSRRIAAHATLEGANRSIDWFLEHAKVTDVEECPFDGEVDVAYWNVGRTWTCPICGYEHEEEED